MKRSALIETLLTLLFSIVFLSCPGSGVVLALPLDGDGDGVSDDIDNCPFVYNPDQANLDADEVAAGQNDTRLDTTTAGASTSYHVQISSDSDGRVYVTWSDSRNGTGDIYFNRSMDNGATWLTSDIRLDTNAAGSSVSHVPQISNDSEGHVYVAWEDSRNHQYDIYFSRSLDYGATWLSSDIRLDTGGAGPSTKKSYYPQISSDSAGHVYVTWQDSRSGQPRIYFNRSSDYGATWLPSDIHLDKNVAGGSASELPQISSDSAGNVYVTWQDSRDGQADIYFNRSSDYGATWLPNDIRLDTDAAGASASFDPQISSDSSGHVYVTWSDLQDGGAGTYFNCSSDYGATWQLSDTRIDTCSIEFSSSHRPQMSSDSEGHVYVTWRDSRDGQPDIYFNRSSDYGATWLPSDIRLDTSGAGASDSSLPQISNDAAGGVCVTWEDYRNGQSDIYLNCSPDHGATWLQSDIRLDTDAAGASYSGYPQISSDSDGHAHVTWTDERNGQPDIYVNTVILGDSFGDACDNCPALPNPDQEDSDVDGLGNACDACPNDPFNDADADDICDNIDNCPATPNPEQEDCNGDGVGDACDAVNPGADDSDCDGVDDDCNGLADDAYAPTPTSCGVGECASTGEMVCLDGTLQDSCVAGTPSAEACDSLDNDCDGSVADDGVDEVWYNQPTICGEGECVSAGALTCQGGNQVDTCIAGSPTGSDADCDGLDQDCDGIADNNYPYTPTSCGVGECESTGEQTCVNGTLQDSCVAGTPSAEACDSLDNDCDGSIEDDGIDESWFSEATTCGEGECASTGILLCQAGAQVDTCEAGTPSAEICGNGLDEDCDGSDLSCDDIDNDGDGYSENQGDCNDADELINPAVADADCDGVDQNCDGTADEEYEPTPTECGTGECASAGELSCINGSVVDTCEAGPPDSETCDDTLDNDCDGLTDCSDSDCDGAPECGPYTIYVDDTNCSDTGSGASALPYCTINKAIEKAYDGDTIIVRDGTYVGAGNKNLGLGGKAITLRSESGPESCIIDCEGDGRAFHLHSDETADSVVDGFTIVNGSVTDNGGAILCEGASPTITNCIISSSEAYAGGGILVGGAAAPALTNCVITGNEASYGGGIYFSGCGGAILLNCTISDNMALAGGGISLYASSLTIENSILWNNAASYGASYGPEILVGATDNCSSVAIGHSDVEGGASSVYVDPGCALDWDNATNIDADPLFVQPRYWDGVDWNMGDYRLSCSSPCIDAGTDAGVDADIERDARPQGAGYEIGSDEYVEGTQQVTLTLIPDSEVVSRGGILGYTVTVSNCDGSPVAFDYWTNATRPDGIIHPPSGALLGPYPVTLPGLGSRSAHRTHPIPAVAPLGAYTYNAYIGDYPATMNEYYFNFDVTP
ncbi:exo-alpha-sialidase [Candidatus Poribacteria bacterium]|nr:exo-alpha-sialidase [Candidatus Poribacteria bacterium]